MRIRFHPHARLRLSERGTTESEVREAIEEGEIFLGGDADEINL